MCSFMGRENPLLLLFIYCMCVLEFHPQLLIPIITDAVGTKPCFLVITLFLDSVEMACFTTLPNKSSWQEQTLRFLQNPFCKQMHDRFNGTFTFDSALVGKVVNPLALVATILGTQCFPTIGACTATTVAVRDSLNVNQIAVLIVCVCKCRNSHSIGNSYSFILTSSPHFASSARKSGEGEMW